MAADLTPLLGKLLMTAAMFGIALPLAAQDTPEMLAAMRAHLAPLPDDIPEREALPPALLAQLPATVLETHRWHADPAQRFVILRGRRIEEDGVADRDLWLREIRPDGAVFQFRDAFFFQPR